MIRLKIPLDVLARRRTARQRELDIATNSDLARIDRLLAEWFSQNPPASPVLEVDYLPDDISFSKSITRVMDFIGKHT